MTGFEKINDWIRNSETSAVNLLSAVAPWGAPLAPASMSYGGMVDHLGYSPFVAGVIACVIEILGLATVHTTLIFWRHNRRYSSDVRKMPTALAGGMFALYLVIILTVNVVLEWPVQWVYTPILARALLSMLAVPASIILAVRTLHTELIHEIRDKHNHPQSPATTRNQNATKTQPEVAKSNRDRILELHYSQPDKRSVDIAQVVGVSRQYVDKVISKNGVAK